MPRFNYVAKNEAGATIIDDAEPADDASELNAELNRQRPVNGQR